MVVGNLTDLSFLYLSSEIEYKEYFYKTYCSKPIYTFDGIPVTFRRNKFNHAFFESSEYNKKKIFFLR